MAKFTKRYKWEDAIENHELRPLAGPLHIKEYLKNNEC